MKINPVRAIHPVLNLRYTKTLGAVAPAEEQLRGTAARGDEPAVNALAAPPRQAISNPTASWGHLPHFRALRRRIRWQTAMQAAHLDDDVNHSNMNARGVSGNPDTKILAIAARYYKQRVMFSLSSAKIHRTSPYLPGLGGIEPPKPQSITKKKAAVRFSPLLRR